MATVCVFTPTYNRAYILGKLYESLRAQTCGDFRWFVIDDGSTDGTEELVRGWAEEGAIPITFMRTANGGKPRAIDAAVARCDDELFFVVDSDDHLVPTAIEQVVARWQGLRDDGHVAGIVAERGTDEDTPLGTRMPPGVAYTTIWDLYHKHRFRGDTSLVYRTAILRRYPYDVAPGENFIAETSVYYQIDDSYVMATYDHVLTICHYLPDGLTKNFAANAKRNPVGYWRHKRECARRSQDLVGRARETILYLCGCMMAGKKDAIRDAPYVGLAVLCWIPALVARHTVFR